MSDITSSFNEIRIDGDNNKIYISYASSEGEGSGGNTAIASAAKGIFP